MPHNPVGRADGNRKIAILRLTYRALYDLSSVHIKIDIRCLRSPGFLESSSACTPRLAVLIICRTFSSLA